MAEYVFNPSEALTLGAEVELQLIDSETLDLRAAVPEMLALLKDQPHIKPEIFLSILEINAGICHNAQEIEAILDRSTDAIVAAGESLGLLIASTGSHPFARYSERIATPSKRYDYLIDRNQWIARRLMICGLHVHLGMQDGEDCIRFYNFFLHLLPHLLALSTSSPFWQGDATGLASCRSTIFESTPTGGHPCPIADWAEFAELCRKLERCGAITSHKDIWWDVRPSPKFGTLEIRVCDGLASLAETMALVAFIHALAHWFARNRDAWSAAHPTPPLWVIRENKWRAARHGLEAAHVINGDAETEPLRQSLEDWLKRLQPLVKEFGYGPYFATLRRMLHDGTSAERQRRVFETTGSLDAVVRHNCLEFLDKQPNWLAAAA